VQGGVSGEMGRVRRRPHPRSGRRRR
jgi:hypothetical protein